MKNLISQGGLKQTIKEPTPFKIIVGCIAI